MTAPTEGYPDFQRMSLSSGYLLGGGNGDIPGGLTIFRGYVGSWGYINEFFQNGQQTDFYQLQVLYFTDGTFDTRITEQFATRGGENLVGRQWPVISPWVWIYIVPMGARVVDSCSWAFYGSNQLSSSASLNSEDVNFIGSFNTIAAGATIVIGAAHITPGPATLSVSQAAVSSYYVELDYYDPGSAGWKVFLNINDFCYPGGWLGRISLPDAPVRMRVHNGGSASVGMGTYITAEL